jgi:putrescine aminotransferase
MTEVSNTALNERDRARLVALDAAHHLHPFTDTAALAGEGGARIITHAEGCWLHDADGRRILDGMAGLWCVNVGYGRKELAEVAYRQMLELPYYNTFFKTATVPSVELAAKLTQLLPDGFNHVFFANSGSEANDTVVRLVRHYWNLRGQPKRKTIISRRNAYHGSTVAGASLGGMEAMHAQADLPIPGIVHIAQPYWFGEGGDMTPEEFGHHAAHELELKIIELGPENVAAFIGEPIQGAGGVIIPPDSYWPEINRICKHYGILLIADEVICGFGRTGEWFGTRSFGIEPDLMPMAKGLSSGYLPISALGVHDRVARLLIEEGGEFFHGFTYSGHPTAAAVALRNVEIIEREGLVERTREVTGPHLAGRLADLADHPLVGEVRSRGLIGAIELCADKATRRRFDPLGAAGTVCRDHFFAHDAIMRACGDTMVLSPPLIITEAEIDHLMAVTRTCLDLTWEDVKDWR